MLLPAEIVGIGLVLIPVILATRTSFASSASTGTPTGWTLKNYSNFVSGAGNLGSLGNSVEIAALTVVVCLAVAWPAVIFAHQAGNRTRRIFMLIVLAPLLISVVVRSYALVILFAPSSPLNGLLPSGLRIHLIFTKFGVVLGLAYTVLPFMFLPILSSRAAVDPNLERAASSLGARRSEIFRHITIPMTLPGVVAGSTLVFSLSMTAYVIPLLIGGTGRETVMSLVSQDVLTLFDWPHGFAVCIILVVVASIVVIVGRTLAAYVGRWSEA